MSDKQPHLFCFGLGYVGLVLAKQLLDQGWKVSGSLREASQISQLRSLGVNAFVFNSQDKDQDVVELPLADVTHILSTIPPGIDGDPVCELLRDCKDVSWIGYLSTTGVYGNTEGKLVDETCPVKPGSSRAARRVEAERRWLALFEESSLPVHIFRLPGIYGPGRCVFEQYKEKRLRRIDKPGHLFNRVHVDDIAQVLQASMKKSNPGTIYNVCDDFPSEPANVATYACELMGVEPPPLVPFEQAVKTMSPMALSFWQDNRRVSNARMKSELGVTLHYPDYRSGLKAIWEGMH